MSRDLPSVGNVESSGDTMKILLASDIHLGYMEKDGIRGKDAMTAFEEVLQLAQKNAVDFVLLGGDLFHENKPSRYCMEQTIELLRKYCLGDKPCEVEFLSDPSVNFGHTAFPTVNYLDPNYNIAMPVFSVHGNHDDPAGQGNFSSMDLLHACGLVNYFGKCLSLDAVELSPLLMQKGATRLALYGLGAVRDERLHRSFCNKSVKMLRPREHYDEWFSVFVLHQNRVRHGQTNYIPEQFLDDFLDLVVWGHEHECLIEPAWNGTQNFYITQPGSTVATSLSDSETKPKHCALLLINGRNFKLRKLPLETVRPFYLEDVVLCESHINPGDPEVVRKVETFCAEKVLSLLDKDERERIGHEQRPDKPLIRLRVDYSGGFELFSTHRFGQKFVDRVANPKDIILFHRRKLQQANEQKSTDNPDDESTFGGRIESLDSTRVEDMVREYFAKADEAKQLQVLTERGMSDAIKEFVDKEEKDAVPELAMHQIKKTQVYLRKRNATEETVEAEVRRFKDERRKNVKQEDSEVQEVISRVRASRPLAESRDDEDDDNDDVRRDDSDDNDTRSISFASPARGQSRGSRRPSRGRGESTRRGGRGRGGRGRANTSVAEEPATLTSRGSKTRSIMDAFSMVPSSKRSIVKSHAVSSSEDECTIIDDEDDNTVSHTRHTVQYSSTVANAKRSRLEISAKNSQSSSGTSRSGRKMGVNFGSDDSSEEDEFDRSIPQRKKKR